MSEPLLSPLISNDDIEAELGRRRSKKILKTVTATKPALLREKVKIEEADGWEIDRKNKKSYRMAQPKPSDEQLEDELWCILAQMGFKELSNGRQFTISVGDNVPARPIDVFVKDDETALIVECTHRKTQGKKQMANLIEKIKAIREPVLKSITKYYGRQVKLKVKFIIATRNIAWSDVDLVKCKDADIAVITDNEIDYYRGLIQRFKHAARYQLLGHMFGGTGIKGLAHKVVATKGTMGGDKFYTFLIRPEELLKIAYVGHKASRDIENLNTYQRMLQTKRLKDIAKYINGGGKFPTNIVVNLNTTRRTGLKFEEKEKIGDESLGVLHLPANYASAWIVDGQHRLYGYAYAQQGDGYNNDKTTLPVLAYENLPADKEMKLFIDINSKQVKMAPGLLSELYSDLHWYSTDSEKAFQALLSRVASRLNSEKTSPLNERMVVTGKKKTPYRCLTQTSIRDGMEKAKLLGTFSKGSVLPGPFSTVDSLNYNDNLKKSLSILSECVRLFAEAMPEHWNLGDRQGGYLCTNIGLRALFHVLKDLSDHVTLTTGADLRVLSADDAFEAIKPLLLVLVRYFKDATPQEILAFRQIGSSLSLVQQQSWGMEAQINKQKHEFMPAHLQDYLNSRDEQGTEEAATKLRKINKQLFDYVIRRLKEQFGSDGDSWWTEGVPLTIRQNCSKEWEAKKREGLVESYLYLRDYVDISLANWEIMKNVISLDAKDKSAKKQNVKWINELNEISKKTKHPEKGPLTTEQVTRVSELFKKVESYFSKDN